MYSLAVEWLPMNAAPADIIVKDSWMFKSDGGSYHRNLNNIGRCLWVQTSFCRRPAWPTTKCRNSSCRHENEHITIIITDHETEDPGF
jgi:hypothetical protein